GVLDGVRPERQVDEGEPRDHRHVDHAHGREEARPAPGDERVVEAVDGGAPQAERQHRRAGAEAGLQQARAASAHAAPGSGTTATGTGAPAARSTTMLPKMARSRPEAWVAPTTTSGEPRSTARAMARS